MTTPSAGTAGMAPTHLQTRQRVGLLLLLVGVGLVVGGFFVPWLTRTCTGHCLASTTPEEIGPLELFGALFISIYGFPVLLVVTTLGYFLLRQERLPPTHPRRSAIPALLLAGLLLVGAVAALIVMYLLVSLLSIYPRHAFTPVWVWRLAPAWALIPVGVALVALGGWLRYHPTRLVLASPPSGSA